MLCCHAIVEPRLELILLERSRGSQIQTVRAVRKGDDQAVATPLHEQACESKHGSSRIADDYLMQVTMCSFSGSLEKNTVEIQEKRRKAIHLTRRRGRRPRPLAGG